MRTIIRETAEIYIKMYESNKYNLVDEEPKRIKYSAGKIESFEVLSGEDAREFEKRIDVSSIDEDHEYLVLYFKGSDDTATFRNSHVDMLIW